MTKTLLAWLLIPLCMYAFVAALVWAFQARLIFLPTAELVTDPASRNMTFEDIWLRTSDGEKLHGWFVPGPEKEPVVLFFHGNAGNISHRVDTIQWLRDAGAGVFLIDYRGYGNSSGKASELGTYRDAEAAWHFLTRDRQFAPSDVIVFGRSLGGGVASWLAARERAGLLVLESTFTSVPAVAAQIYPWLPVRWLSTIRYDTASRVRDLATPTVIIHSIDDELIGFDHGQSLYAQAANPVELVPLSGSHNEGYLRSSAIYRDAWQRIIRRVAQGGAIGSKARR